MKKEALKAQLMAGAEAAIEELLAGRKAENTLSEIENLVEATGHSLQQDLTGTLVKLAGQPSGPGPMCEQCGREMRYKGQKKRQVVTKTGEVEIERAYYYCKACQCGTFPPG